MIDSQLKGNKYMIKESKIRLLFKLNNNNIKCQFTFNELLNGFHQNTLSKYLTYFIDLGCIDVEEISERKRNYQITDKGRSEYQRLLAEKDYKDKILPNCPDIIDSIEIKPSPIKSGKDTFSCQGNSLISTFLNEKEKELIEREINKKILPQILELYKDKLALSGSLTLSFYKEEKK